MRLIDADKLRADVLSWENCYNGFSDTYDKARIIDAIDEQPTAEKRGRWVEASTDGAVFCSECGTEWLSEAARYYNFCPICGAKMEASDD